MTMIQVYRIELNILRTYCSLYHVLLYMIFLFFPPVTCFANILLIHVWNTLLIGHSLCLGFKSWQFQVQRNLEDYIEYGNIKIKSALRDNLWLVLRHKLCRVQGVTRMEVCMTCVVMFITCTCVWVCGPPHPPGRGLSPLCLYHEHQVLPNKSGPRGTPFPKQHFSFFPPLGSSLHSKRASGSIKRNREREERRSCPPCDCIWKWYIEAWGVFSA